MNCYMYTYMCMSDVSPSDIFSLGFGPFRWVCTSVDPADLAVTDNITLQVLDSIIAKGGQFHKISR